MLLDDARKQITRLQATNEERNNAFKRLQKRLLLVSHVSVRTQCSVIGCHRVMHFHILIIFLVLPRMICFEWPAISSHCPYKEIVPGRAYTRLFRGHIGIDKYFSSSICLSHLVLISVISNKVLPGQPHGMCCCQCCCHVQQIRVLLIDNFLMYAIVWQAETSDLCHW